MPGSAWAATRPRRSGRAFACRRTHSAYLIERFLEQYHRSGRELGTRLFGIFSKYAAPLHPMPVDLITLRDVADLLTKLDKSSGSTTTNRVRSTLSARLQLGDAGGVGALQSGG